jgi:nucleoside 2-deoxyribosyltransferase
MFSSIFEQKFGKRDIGFLIRKFEERTDRSILIQTVKETFKENGLKIADTLEHRFHNELWPNIKEYLDNCDFGVIVIDNFSPQGNNQFNPNIFLEIGYLLALGKDILILLQNSLERELPADVKPFMYQTFDSEEKNSPILKNKISQWIKNYKSKPGYLTIYFKKYALNLDFMEEFKNLIYVMSDCEVISNKSTSVDLKDLEELKIDCNYGAMKVLFKICSIETAHKFKDDFQNNRYIHVKEIADSVLKVDVSNFPDSIKPSNEGVSYLLNNETEELVYCTRESITNCDEEINYAKQLFKRNLKGK